MKMTAEGIRTYIYSKCKQAQVSLEFLQEHNGAESHISYYTQGYVQALKDVLSHIR